MAGSRTHPLSTLHSDARSSAPGITAGPHVGRTFRSRGPPSHAEPPPFAVLPRSLSYASAHARLQGEQHSSPDASTARRHPTTETRRSRL